MDRRQPRPDADLTHAIAHGPRRRAGFDLTVFGVFLVLYAVLAIGQNPWWWAAFAMFAAFFVGQVVLPRRLDRRAAALSTPPQPAG